MSGRVRKLEGALSGAGRWHRRSSRDEWTQRWTRSPENRAVFEAAVAEARRLAPGLARRDGEIDAGLCTVALTIGVELIADEVGGREQAERACQAFFESAARYQRVTGDLFPIAGFCLREWGMGAEITLPILPRDEWPRPRPATRGAA